jgi:hypothetical protein
MYFNDISKFISDTCWCGLQSKKRMGKKFIALCVVMSFTIINFSNTENSILPSELSVVLINYEKNRFMPQTNER